METFIAPSGYEHQFRTPMFLREIHIVYDNIQYTRLSTEIGRRSKLCTYMYAGIQMQRLNDVVTK